MTYRELSMIEVKEILRLWLDGRSLREVCKLSGAEGKTVRAMWRPRAAWTAMARPPS
jgi:hypothetical protein